MIKRVFSRVDLIIPVAILFFIFAFFLRTFGGLDSMLFTYDQARDAFFAQDIISGNLKIVGPPTDIGGVFHGPLYYYFLAPFYLIGAGNPQTALLGVILVNILAGIPLIYLVLKMFGNKWLSLVSLVLYFVSFESISYARWLSNPALAAPVMIFYVLGLWLLAVSNRWSWVFLALGIGLSIQFQLFMLYLLPAAVFAIIFFKAGPNIKKQFNEFLLGLIILTLLLGSYFASEIKFHFQGVLGLWHFFGGENHGINIIGRLTNYFWSLEKVFVYNLFPVSEKFGIIFSLGIILMALFAAYKDRTLRKPFIFVSFILCSHILVFIFSTTMLTFIGLGINFAVIILVIIDIKFLARYSKLPAILLLTVIIVSNLAAVKDNSTYSNFLFKVQPGMALNEKIALIKKTYDIADGREFSINTVTNPYLFPTTWAYLYKYYAQKNNLSLPYYRGITAYTYKGEDVFPKSDKIRRIDFLIIEPEVGAANSWAYQLFDKEKHGRNLKDTLLIGKFTLYYFEKAG